MDENEFKQLQEMFKQTLEQTIKERDPKGATSERVMQLVNSDLGADALAYIQRQLNNASFLGYVNKGQHNIILKSSVKGLFKLIYVKYYKEGEELVEKDPIYESCKNLLILLFSRPLEGRDRAMAMEEIKAKQQNNIIVPSR